MKLIPSEKIEPIIFKVAQSDTKYALLLGEMFKPEWFEDKDFGNMISILFKYYKKFSKLPNKKTIDIIVSKHYPKDYKEIILKINTALEIDVQTYDKDIIENEIVNYIRHRGTLMTILENMDEISSKHNIDDLLDNLSKLSSMDFDVNFGMDYISDIEARIDEYTNPKTRMSTGWDDIDKVMAGGLPVEGKVLVLFMGETHIGKSLMLSNVAANMIKDNKFVIIISLEMSEMVYASRIDAHVSNLNINKLGENTSELKKSVELISDFYPEGKILIKEFPPDTINCLHIKNYVQRVISTYGRKPDCICIDYLTLLNSITTQGDNSYGKYKDVAAEMRALGYYFDCPIVSAGQINRCLTLDSEIITKARGVINLGGIKLDDEILGSSGYTKVTKIYPKTRQKIYQITTKSGKIIKCSAKHQFPTDSNQLKSIETGLSINDSLKIKKL